MAEEEQPIESQEEAKYGLTYDGSLSSRIEKMVNNKLLSDVTFIVGPDKQRIHAHKMPLVAASQYFYTLFYGSFAEVKLDEIELKDEDPEIFLTILRLIYGVKVKIGYDNIRDVHDHMRMYLLPTECYKPLINFLKEQIVDKDSALKIFRENHHYKFQHVDEVCLPYIQSNPLYYFRKDDFTKIEEEVMLKIVGLHHINCTDEQLLYAFETCEFTNGKYDKKELRKLVSGTARKTFSHKLPFVSNMVQCATKPGCEKFSLSLTSAESVSLYGIGLYIVPTSGDVSVKLGMRGTDGNYNEICILNYANRSTPCLEIVDLMFEEIVLVKNKKYEFRLAVENSNGYICFNVSSYPTLGHDNIKVAYSFSQQHYVHACAHLWIKNPECAMRTNQAPQLCCQMKKY